MIYLATPYSHPDHAVMEDRFLAVNTYAAYLMQQGKHVFSPISHTHPIALAGELPRGWDFWEQYDRTMLAACDSLVVYCQDGWSESIGVTAEISIATEMGLEIEYVWPDGCQGGVKHG